MRIVRLLLERGVTSCCPPVSQCRQLWKLNLVARGDVNWSYGRTAFNRPTIWNHRPNFTYNNPCYCALTGALAAFVVQVLELIQTQQTVKHTSPLFGHTKECRGIIARWGTFSLCLAHTTMARVITQFILIFVKLRLFYRLQ